jgi:dTDP-4-amino-4,6-dideoxygalactose transaminase
MTTYRIPFNRATLAGAELRYVAEAIRVGHISGDGPFTKKCERELETLLGVPRALLTTSCTHALEMAAILLDLRPGDEVVLPTFTFVSTANAFVLRGARPVFVDIREDTLNLDERKLEACITSQTRAIVPVHYAGVGCEMENVLRVARKHRLKVVEDNAHGFMGSFRGRPLGTFGDLGTLSFHETKNFTCGEGGALLINNRALIDRAEIIREKGTDRARFFRGQVDKYSWRDIGSSYIMSDMLAAFLYAQLKKRESIQRRRMSIWQRYYEELATWAELRDVRLPFVPSHCQHPAHLFYLLFPDRRQRDRMIDHLKTYRILSVFHYVPLHLSPMGRRFGGRRGQYPVAESISDRLLRLPLFAGLSAADQREVIRRVRTCSI